MNHSQRLCCFGLESFLPLVILYSKRISPLSVYRFNIIDVSSSPIVPLSVLPTSISPVAIFSELGNFVLIFPTPVVASIAPERPIVFIVPEFVSNI